MADAPQLRASDPKASVFVAANAGSGKTSTLVRRVARLLLGGAEPASILCVTYTKAAAAEMQRRLFQMLGDWAVAPNETLRGALLDLGEPDRDLSDARALFARALETPGGLRIQTIHAFCEGVLRRFPLEAGLSPAFKVLEEAAAAELSVRAREGLARFAMAEPDGPVAQAYAHFCIQLDWRSFQEMFKTFGARRLAIEAFVAACGGERRAERKIWARCGFARPIPPENLEAEALAATRWNRWRRAVEALKATGKASDAELGGVMAGLIEAGRFSDLCAVFCTAKGEPLKRLGTNGLDGDSRAWLIAEQGRLLEARESVRAATVARDSALALTLALAYGGGYAALKLEQGALDFADLIERTRNLLAGDAGAAAWVLYKLDGGITHALLDEAQDTAPDQWSILRVLTAEFFADVGLGTLERTVFAVGDEKQSIFSFQGAAPERMAIEARTLRTLVEAAGQRFVDVPLFENWRSAPEILAFVDTVFQDPDAVSGLGADAQDLFRARPVTHIPRRTPFGCVELWPLEVGEPTVELDPWEPVDADPAESANKRLARRIAVEVKAMVARGDGVDVRGAKPDEPATRPARYGDVLILVRRRGALFDEVIRALKREGAPVGGADRMKLSEHVVFDDLMALGRFVRFPGDDLTLASLLRSPLCDVDEEGLFDLAWSRSGALWTALRERADENQAWRAAFELLDWARAEAVQRPPFDFYSRVVARPDSEGRTIRQRMLTRLGAEAEDALDAFLAEALAAEGRDVRDLESFLAAMAGAEIEVKREQDDTEGRTVGEVRVMTVHGAKGLEAPIVILPDTSTRASALGGPLLEGLGGFLWAPRKPEDCPASAQARAARERANAHESARLLYVALTRARDRLIVAGVESRMFAGSWRDFVQRAFAKVASRPYALADGAEARRFGLDPVPAPPRATAADAAPALPTWVSRPPPSEPSPVRFVSPSGLGPDDPTPATSPLASLGGLGRFRRGELIHGLLQVLPDLAPDGREAAARRRLAREPGLSDDQREEMIAAALAVLSDARFAAVFGPGSKAEVALAGASTRLPVGLAVSGRVDRLLVEPDRVLVVDFKTNRPAPRRIEDAPKAYIAQMAAYAAVLGEIYPGRRIEAALLWTDGPNLMTAPEKLISAALDEIAASR